MQGPMALATVFLALPLISPPIAPNMDPDASIAQLVARELTAICIHTDAPEERGSEFQKGQLVRHPTFGLGRIAELTNMGQHTRAVIEFNQVGRKTLILQYARLEAVG